MPKLTTNDKKFLFEGVAIIVTFFVVVTVIYLLLPDKSKADPTNYPPSPPASTLTVLAPSEVPSTHRPSLSIPVETQVIATRTTQPSVARTGVSSDVFLISALSLLLLGTVALIVSVLLRPSVGRHDANRR